MVKASKKWEAVMNVHEYQAKEVLQRYGVNVPKGFPALSLGEATDAAKKLQGGVFVVKAQIHAGGRGKGGGVKVVKSLDDVASEAKKMLGMQLVTHQTGPQGRLVRRLYIEEGSDIDQEFYLSMLVDRATSHIAIVASKQGGMEIEEVAAKDPSAVVTIDVDPATGLSGFHARRVAKIFGLKGAAAKKMGPLLAGLYAAFCKEDMSMLEINPLVLTKQEDLICLDAKIDFDDNALFRHQDIFALRDTDEEDPIEVEASRFSLNYIRLDGNIACMVNGAGLAMATMDMIKLHGASPANFLDVGGGATQEKVTEAFKIILSDPHVKGILVNIFGGIMRCDVIAQGIIAAAKEVSLSVPLVVRLEGTNVDLGKEILQKSGLAVIAANDLDDAAKKVVAAIQGGK